MCHQGKNIQTNLHTVRSMLEICQRTQDSAPILQLDLAKAFDRVDHYFLFALLKHLNIGEIIEKGVKLCYKDISTKLLLNGSLTKSILVRRSVRQGCPLSPLLFNIYLEPLCRNIINDKDIQGFRLHACEVKLLVLICSNKPSIVTAMSHVDDYCPVSGALVKKDKSSGSWCGEWGTTPAKFVDIEWTTNKPQLLGVPLNAMDNPKPMWDSLETKVKSAVRIWKLRDVWQSCRLQYISFVKINIHSSGHALFQTYS